MPAFLYFKPLDSETITAMRVLFFLPYGRYTPTFEWCLDAIQKHLDAGDSGVVLLCDGELPGCDINESHRYSVCQKCIHKRRDGIQMLSGNFATQSFLNLTEDNRKELSRLPSNFENLKALMDFRFDGFDAGMGVASTIISRTRNPNFSAAQYKDWIRLLLRAACAVYRSVQNHLAQSKYDRIYLLNGRVAIQRGAFMAALSKGVECHVVDNGGTIDRSHVYINQLPHSIAYTNQLMRQAWESAAADPLGGSAWAGRSTRKPEADKRSAPLSIRIRAGCCPEILITARTTSRCSTRRKTSCAPSAKNGTIHFTPARPKGCNGSARTANASLPMLKYICACIPD